VFPDVDSSLGLVWAVAAIVWGIVFVAAAQLTHDPKRPTLRGSPAYPDTGVEPGRGSTTNTPRWVYVSGIIVIVLVLLFAIRHLTGGGFVPH
jgi:hypothetical protein